MEFEALKATLEKQYDEFPPLLRKASRYVIQQPADIAFVALRPAAKNAGVSPTTLIRLATTLGFKSYEDFRETFRQALRSGSQRYSAAATQVVGQRGHQGFGALFERTGLTLSEQIKEVFQSIPVAEVERAGQGLVQAKHVYVLGLRSCFAAAFYFRYVGGLFADNVRLIDSQKGMLVDEVLGMDKQDALLVLSFDPYPVDTVRTVNFARSRGAFVVAITDNTLSPIGKPADVTFVVPASNISYYTSLVPSMALMEALISYMLMQAGKKGVGKIQKRFGQLEEQGVYWSDDVSKE